MSDTKHADPLLFSRKFELLLGFPPMPWQEQLFKRFLQGELPSSCDIPTGLGKTAVMAIWLLALARESQLGYVKLPRRLVYVVNRRTVVDQSTREAERMRQALCTPELAEEAMALRNLCAAASDCPLAISTLRGQFADNAEWRIDPAKPAVIVGTVDMIGSRLLFSGYGRGFKSRPLHAGFLGQDSLLVHDEAHLEPAFQALITAIEAEQARCRDIRPLRVLALTATSRGNQNSFGLTEEERTPDSVASPSAPLREVWTRTSARKGVKFHPLGEGDWKDKDSLPNKVVELAMSHDNTGQAILVFLRRVDDVEKVARRLPANRTQSLTGTMRGRERDALVNSDPVFARFLRKDAVNGGPRSDTVFLVCTSAGEVGVNISADHLVCDLTPFDSIAQRFGRVNRFGAGDARIDIVHSATVLSPGGATVAGDELRGDVTEVAAVTEEEHTDGDADDGQSALDLACAKTQRLLQRLPLRKDGRLDASPLALATLPLEDRQAAFSPAPVIPAVTDILFDAWALTSIRGKMPGRPPVADWLHGIAAWEAPETHVAWRAEVSLLRDDILQQVRPEDLLDDYPLKPNEALRDTTERIKRELKTLSRIPANALLPVWVRSDDGSVTVTTLADMLERDDFDLRGETVLLPPEMGGLSARGTLDAKAKVTDGTAYDVADEWKDEQGLSRRKRIWDEEAPPPGMRLATAIDCAPYAAESTGDDESASRRWWRWYVQPRSADDDGSRNAVTTQELVPHLARTAELGTRLVDRLGILGPSKTAVVLASAWHDRGKRRQVWQHAIGNRGYPDMVLAKPAGKMLIANLNNYRHELGSLIDVQADAEFASLSEEVKDLVLHFIASHHGRARPHFFEGEAFDSEHHDSLAIAAAREAPRRFARLQRRYGRWGLAYLESLLRAADALASQADHNGNEITGGPR